MTKLREQLRKEREDSTSEEKDRYKQLESKKDEAIAQSLANKEERIQVLEGRLEQVTANSTKLNEELQSTRKQNEKLKHMAKNFGYNSLRRWNFMLYVVYLIPDIFQGLLFHSFKVCFEWCWAYETEGES